MMASNGAGIQDNQPNMCAAALWYARQGRSVFPVHSAQRELDGKLWCSCGKADCANKAKHPRTDHGFKDATTDETQIKKWWKRWPDANIGISTGQRLLVLDRDDRAGGDASLAALEAEHGTLPETPEVITGFGRHKWMLSPPDRPIPNSNSALGPGLDVRGDGGYALAPPSLHISGRRYEWEHSARINEVTIADAPSWLIELITQNSASTNGQGFRATDHPIHEGQGRNTYLYRVGRSARGKGYSPESIRALMLAEDKQWCKPPIAEQADGEFEKILTSVLKGRNRSDFAKSHADFQEFRLGRDAELGPEPDWVKDDSWDESCGGSSNDSNHSEQKNNASARNVHEFQFESDDDPGPKPQLPEPQRLPSGLPAVPQLGTDLLPEPMRPWLVDIAERAQAALEYPAIGAITALGATIGRRLGIYPKRHDTWRVVPNQWGVAVGRPGILKSPMLDESIKPLKRLEAQAKEGHERKLEEYELEQEAIEAERHKIKARAGSKNSTLSRGEMIDELRKLKTDPPTRNRYITNDPTVEALGILLNQNPAGLLLFRDEGSGWLKTMDRSGHENDRAFYLQCWNGFGAYNYDRVGRGHLDVEATCMSILVGMTPGPLGSYLRETFSGEQDDGLIQRFQLAVYPDCDDWKNIDRAPDRQAQSRVFRLFEQLAALNTPSNDDDIPMVRFSDEAQELFDDWRATLETRVRSPDEHPVMLAHLSKYRSLMPSLALIFHSCETFILSETSGLVLTSDIISQRPVSAASAQLAISWCKHLEPHARRIYHSVTASVDHAAKIIGERIRARKLPDPFTARDVYRTCWGGLGDRENVVVALELLKTLNGSKLNSYYQP